MEKRRFGRRLKKIFQKSALPRLTLPLLYGKFPAFQMERKPEPYPDNMKYIKIISTHATLTEAVAAAGLDLSYNEAHARRHIRDIETGWNGRSPAPEKALVLEIEGKATVYTIATHDGIRFLNKFSPFCSVMHNGPLFLWILQQDAGVIARTEVTKEKDRAGRASARKDCELSPAVMFGE